jgi:hypothetical protein
MEIADNEPSSVPIDIAKRLGEQGIRHLLTLLTNAYRDLYARQWVTADSPEDSITEEWFVHIQSRWSSNHAFGLVPIHQKQDRSKAKSRGRAPTVDFCFRDKFFQRSYFGAECKLLDQGSRKHLNAYLGDKEGIGRFVSGQYSSNTGAGAMVGYVRRGDCCIVAKDVSSEIKRLKGNPTLKKSRPLPDFDHLYESQHNRDNGVSPFLCYHLFFVFNC